MNHELFMVLSAHAQWLTRKFGVAKPEHFLFPFGRTCAPAPIDPDRPTTTLKTVWGSMHESLGVKFSHRFDNRSKPDERAQKIPLVSFPNGRSAYRGKGLHNEPAVLGIRPVYPNQGLMLEQRSEFLLHSPHGFLGCAAVGNLFIGLRTMCLLDLTLNSPLFLKVAVSRNL
jgi:hypothetical protein